MKSVKWQWVGALALGAAAALPAQADAVDFEDVVPTLFSGTSVDSGKYRFTSSAAGFSGVDNAGAFSLFANAPTNAQGQFLFALNNDGIALTSVDGSAFFLNAFSASFVAPVGGLAPNALAGELLLVGDTGSGTVSDRFVFSPSDALGNFAFSDFFTDDLLGVPLRSVTFTACVYQNNGDCLFNTFDLPGQFALDNIRIPEPLGLVLAATGLGLMAGFRRRRAA